jgi:hypothetical protein
MPGGQGVEMVCNLHLFQLDFTAASQFCSSEETMKMQKKALTGSLDSFGGETIGASEALKSSVC